MRVAMLTNTYLPHVGGVARSVSGFAAKLRELGCEVLVAAPTFEGDAAPDEADVVRVPAIQNFNGSDFSVRLPIPGLLGRALDDFRPQVIHAHHPFLLGDTALRVATGRELPLIFTHHTMYERYTHYVPGDSEIMRRFAVRLATEYANLCDHVIAPSESVATLLRERGVVAPITAIPTGVEPERFRGGAGATLRRELGIAPDAFVVGHVGRLAPEKNLELLARAAARLLHDRGESVHLLVAGEGPLRGRLAEILAGAGAEDRLHLLGRLDGNRLADAYAAMNLFAFSSKSETQGMVLAEAMTAGVPVVALDAPGAREVVRDSVNGLLLPGDADAVAFADALGRIAALDEARRREMEAEARRTAEAFTLERSTRRLLDVYGGLIHRDWRLPDRERGDWLQAMRRLETEWTLWSRRAGAAVEAFTRPDDG